MIRFNAQYVGRVTIVQVSPTAVCVAGKIIEFYRPITHAMIQAIREVIA